MRQQLSLRPLVGVSCCLHVTMRPATAAGDSETAALGHASACDVFERLTSRSWETGEERQGSLDDSVPLQSELLLFRWMLSQLKSADRQSRDRLSRNLTALILREGGLRKLFTATFDFDESSKHVTTIDQRLQAMASLVAAPPVLCCTLNQYYKHVSAQLYALMQDKAFSSEQFRRTIGKLCTLIVNSMIARKRSIAIGAFIEPLVSALEPSTTEKASDSSLSPREAVQVVHRLTCCDFDLRLLLKAFPSLFFAACASSSASEQQRLKAIVIEFLNQIDKSVYLLDDCLFNHFDICSREKASESGSQALNSKLPGCQAKAQCVAAFAVDVACHAFSEENQVDFCLLLLEKIATQHLMSDVCSLLLCIITSSLIERTEPLFLKFPSKLIRFIRDAATRYNSGDVTAASPTRLETKKTLIHITRILVNDSSKVRKYDLRYPSVA